MIYSLGDGNLKRVDVSANNAKNQLPTGTVLKWEGYGYDKEVIVKNLGIDQKFGYGARYRTVSLKDGRFKIHDAFGLAYLADKKDHRIAVYITDEVVSPDECLALYEKAQALEDLEAQQKKTAGEQRALMVEKGKQIARAKGIEDAVALIVAEDEQDESDSQTDYFSTSRKQLVILATSKHKRDLFKEFRKAAAKWDKTAHLGPDRGTFNCYVSFTKEIKSNGWHAVGDRSPWHREISNKTFTTRQEALAYVASAPNPEPVWCDGVEATFKWEIEGDESDIEHREKYSQGHGYYLKASGRYSSGWIVRKYGKWDASKPWTDDIYVSLAQICIL
jgi:hypothetical protein